MYPFSNHYLWFAVYLLGVYYKRWTLIATTIYGTLMVCCVSPLGIYRSNGIREGDDGIYRSNGIREEDDLKLSNVISYFKLLPNSIITISLMGIFVKWFNSNI